MSTSVYPTINLDNFDTSTICSKQKSHVWATPYKFNSKELDQETGLYYYGARFYTPEIGIWLRVDPMSDKYPSMSPYIYCAGNPVILVDPDGMELTDFQLKKNGQIVQLGKPNSEPDRLFNQDKSNSVTIQDKSILPQLTRNQKPTVKKDAEGNPMDNGFITQATTKSADDAAKLLVFMSLYADDEWAVYSNKNGNKHIGTLGMADLAPSFSDMGLKESDVKAMVHSHIKGSEKDEMGNLDGDRGVSPTLKYNYYTYYGVSKNLYKIPKYNVSPKKTPNSSESQIKNIIR